MSISLLFDIEKFIKSEIKKVHIEAFTPDPSIKAEPIQNGRGGGQKRGGGGSRNGAKPKPASGGNSRNRSRSNNRNSADKKPEKR